MSDITDRYFKAAHGMQAGVAMEMNYQSGPTEPKHLRVGVNTAMVDHAGLVGLLIKKGIITQEEYELAICEAMEAEHKRYEKHISDILGGVEITLV